MEITAEDAQIRVALIGTHTKQFVTFFEEFSSNSIVTDVEDKHMTHGDKKYKNFLVRFFFTFDFIYLAQQAIKNGKTRVLKVYVDDIRQV